MTDLKIDYSVIYSEVKVYEKKYKKKDKRGNPVEAKTIQNTILLPKKVPFKSNETVVIMKEKTYQDLINDSNVNTSDLKEEIKAKDDTIRNLEDTINNLEMQLKNQTTKEDGLKETINNILEDLRISNHKSQSLQQEMQEMAMDLTRYQERLENNEKLFDIMDSYYETLLKQAIDTSVGATIIEINKVLKQTNFIQRLKGLKIITPPKIDDKRIIDDNIAKLSKIINDDILLE